MVKRNFQLFIASVFLIGSAFGCCDQPRRAANSPLASQIPVPSAYRLSSQQTMQAVYHWKLLADDIAEQIQDRLAYQDEESREPIYVVPLGVTPFEKAFRELLITGLVENSLSISKDDHEALLLDVNIQLVRHDRNLTETSSGVYKALAPGLFVRRDIALFGPDGRIKEIEQDISNTEINVEAGMFSKGAPETEILITASLIRNDAFVLRKSSIYYISEGEWRHYRRKPSSALNRGVETTYTVVSE